MGVRRRGPPRFCEHCHEQAHAIQRRLIIAIYQNKDPIALMHYLVGYADADSGILPENGKGQLGAEYLIGHRARTDQDRPERAEGGAR